MPEQNYQTAQWLRAKSEVTIDMESLTLHEPAEVALRQCIIATQIPQIPISEVLRWKRTLRFSRPRLTRRTRRPLFRLRDEPWTIKLGFLLGTFAMIGLLFSARFVTGSDHITINYLLLTLGGVLGYFTGVLISPYGPNEMKTFSDIGKAASAFVSGFVLAKADKIFDEAMKNGQIGMAFLGRLAIFAAAFLIMALFSFVARKYVGPSSVRMS
jgi:hypothetical protein